MLRLVINVSHLLLQRDEIIAALERLGQVADAEGQTFEIVVLGGACMVLAYQARQSTRDVDVAICRHARRRWSGKRRNKWLLNLAGQRIG